MKTSITGPKDLPGGWVTIEVDSSRKMYAWKPLLPPRRSITNDYNYVNRFFVSIVFCWVYLFKPHYLFPLI